MRPGENPIFCVPCILGDLGTLYILVQDKGGPVSVVWSEYIVVIRYNSLDGFRY